MEWRKVDQGRTRFEYNAWLSGLDQWWLVHCYLAALFLKNKNKNNQGIYFTNNIYKITYSFIMLKKLIYHDYRTITGFDSCVLTKKSFDRKSNRKSTRNSKFDIWSSFYFRAKPFFFVKTQRYVLCLFALTNFWKGCAKRLPVIVQFSR